MKNKQYKKIIGLGGHCQTAHQIRRYFKTDEAFPLDWWVTPTLGLVDIFETEFADIFREENMKIILENTGPAVTCARYGLMHYHDFDEAKINGIYSPYLVRTKCAKNNEKFSYLISKMLNLSGPILFIRYGQGWAQFQETRCFDEDLLNRFIASAKRLIPNAEIDFLLLNDYNADAGMDGNPMPGVYTSPLNNYDEKEWHGSDKGWDEVFQHHNISLMSES